MSVTRRTLVLSALASVAAGPTLAGPLDRTILPLWPGSPPGGGGPSGPVLVDANGAISNIAVPNLDVFVPTRPNGAAMLVAGGGGYKRIEIEGEARPAGRWLAARGITAFVLAYRLPGEDWDAGPLAPLQDAQRAIRVIRAGARNFGLDPARVGVLGFSAGGHLMGLAATRSDFTSYPMVDATDALSARPAEAALIYPVITLEPPYNHTSTRVRLVGHHPDPAASADWSVETHVQAQCPPVFLVQAEDDAISDVMNSKIMARACERAGVPVDLHIVADGGHGFAMGRPGTASTAWPSWYEAWLRTKGALT